MSIAQGMDAVRTSQPWWILGGLVERSSNDELRSAINADPQQVQITTVTVTDQGDNDDVILTINDIDVEINTGTGGDAASIGADLAEAVNAEPLVRGQVSASFDTTTLTLTGLWPGQSFSVSIASDPGSVLSSVTTTQAVDAADPIPFGRGVVRTGYAGTDELVGLARTAKFTPQVKTITVAYIASAVLLGEVFLVRGEERVRIGKAQVTSASNADTTIDALVAALNSDLPANTVAVTADAASATALVFTAEIAGLEFDAQVTDLGGGASSPAITPADTTGPSPATSIHRALRGVTVRDQASPAATLGGNECQYAANSVLGYCRKGVVAVESSQTVAPGDPVYIELGVTADNGKFFNSSGSSRVQLARQAAVWELDANAATGDLAALRLNL